jgi:hypothetical protein
LPKKSPSKAPTQKTARHRALRQRHRPRRAGTEAGSVTVEKGIRQNLDNQKKDFIQPFFTTLQLVMAGNDTQGLRYGTIETPEKYYLTWKEENPAYNPKTDPKTRKYLPSTDPAIGDSPLDTALVRLCHKGPLPGNHPRLHRVRCGHQKDLPP